METNFGTSGLSMNKSTSRLPFIAIGIAIIIVAVIVYIMFFRKSDEAPEPAKTPEPDEAAQEPDEAAQEPAKTPEPAKAPAPSPRLVPPNNKAVVGCPSGFSFSPKDGACKQATPVTTTPSDACLLTDKTYDQGARCDGSDYRKISSWCCSDYGRQQGYKWKMP